MPQLEFETPSRYAYLLLYIIFFGIVLLIVNGSKPFGPNSVSLYFDAVIVILLIWYSIETKSIATTSADSFQIQSEANDSLVEPVFQVKNQRNNTLYLENTGVPVFNLKIIPIGTTAKAECNFAILLMSASMVGLAWFPKKVDGVEIPIDSSLNTYPYEVKMTYTNKLGVNRFQEFGISGPTVMHMRRIGLQVYK